MSYWTQVREGSDVSQTVGFGMPEANSAQLSSWMKTFSLPRVNPERRERSCPRHFFASVPNTTQTLGQASPGARSAANLIERASDQASNEGKCLTVIGPRGSGKTTKLQPQLALNLHERRQQEVPYARIVDASIQPTSVCCVEARNFLRTQKAFPFAGTYTGAIKDVVDSSFWLQFCCVGAFLARLLDCLRSNKRFPFLWELSAICG